MILTLKRDTEKIISDTCNCQAGKFGYCNHIMAFLFELGYFLLHQIKQVTT